MVQCKISGIRIKANTGITLRWRDSGGRWLDSGYTVRKSISGITDSDWKKLTVYVTPPVSGKGEIQVMSGTSRPLRAFFCQTFFHEKKSFPSPPNPLSLSKKAGQAAPVSRSDGMTRAKSNRRGKATRPETVLVRASPGQSGIFKGQSPLNGRATHPTATRFFLSNFFFY